MIGVRIQPKPYLCRIGLLSLACLFALLASSPASATQFFKCKNADGSTTLSQFPCATDASADTVSVGSGKVGYARPGLTAQETQILRDADKEQRAQAAEQRKAAKQRDKEEQAEEVAEFRCDKAKAHLEVVRDERRRGYSAHHADYHDERLEDAKAWVDSQCTSGR